MGSIILSQPLLDLKVTAEVGLGTNDTLPLPSAATSSASQSCPSVIEPATMATPCEAQPSAPTRLPRTFVDELPSTLAPAQCIPHTVRRVILHVKEYFRTGINELGILREYVFRRPSYDPDAHVLPEHLTNFGPPSAASPTANSNIPDSDSATPLPPWPFSNMSKYLLMNWYHTGSHQKSEAEITRLANDVICNPAFRPTELSGFNAHRENKALDENLANPGLAPFSTDGWREAAVEIEIPIPIKNSPPQTFRVPGLHYRPIVQVIRAAWGAAISAQFHFTPFRKIHVDSAGKESRIFDEVYTSEAWESAHDELQKQAPEPECKLERVIAGLMFWSDSTHLAQFGTASVWPVYMYFANLSKYVRAAPNSGACHHIAYMPSVSISNPGVCSCSSYISLSYRTAFKISFLQ